ncbi:hypothetical protein DFH09DRAFT_1508836 [Mycena vulgaris]|nr:hypothetical protein DFH09DRAFT_1508836 [Mycena vulgaris]
MSDKKRAWEKVETPIADIRVDHWNRSVTKGLDKGVVTPPPAPAPRCHTSATPAHNAGVKGITRKVIRTLEGLGHLDPALEAEADVEEDDDEHEIARALPTACNEGGEEEDRLGDPEDTRLGFITLGLYLTPSMAPRTVALVLWSALAVIAPTEFVRLRSPAVERVYERALGFLMRESERHGTNGTLSSTSTLRSCSVYPIDVAESAVCALSSLTNSPEGAQDVVDAHLSGAIIVKLLTSPSSDVQTRTCLMLGHLSAQKNTSAVVLGEICKRLMQILHVQLTDLVNVSAVSALARISEHPGGLAAIVDADIEPHIVDMTESPDLEIRAQCRIILRNLDRYSLRRSHSTVIHAS